MISKNHRGQHSSGDDLFTTPLLPACAGATGNSGLTGFPLFLGRLFMPGRYVPRVMAITTKRTRFSRRLPDHVTDELCNVLADKKIYPFNDLFEKVFANLKLRNAVSGGEEMLRLRAYEKLQNLVTRGLVEKIGKEYKGTSRVHEASSAYAAAQEAAAQEE